MGALVVSTTVDSYAEARSGGSLDPPLLPRKLYDSAVSPERAALVGLVTGSSRRVDAEQSLEELAGLADAAGATVVLRMLQERPRPDPATYIGSGKVTSLAASCADADVDVVIVDAE